ncbi:MAG: DUF885 domain-containing protein [Gemmatimonadales bacterium]
MPGPAELQALVASTLDQRWHFDPVEATAQGLREHDHRLGDFSAESLRQHVAGLKALAHALEECAVDDLDDEIDRTALLNDLRVQHYVWTRERPHARDPGFWVNHVLEGLYHLMASRQADSARRHAVQARLEAAPGLLAAAEATLAKCPRPFVETACAMLVGGRQLVDELSVLSGDEAFAQAQGRARSALGRFHAHLQGELMDGAQEHFAIGLDGFNYRLAFQHALRWTTPEVLRYGATLIDQVSSDLDALAAQLRPGTAWPDLLDRLRADHPAPEGLVAAYAAAMERGRAFVAERGLVSLAETPLEVVATPGFLAPVIPFAAYQPPGAFAPDGVGRFYVTEAQDGALRDHARHEIPVTALHEGWPGHHLQFARASRLERVVRRVISTPVTVEGWALYCEDLLAEQGFLASGEERFFQHVALLLRALRIVLDVGLHTQDLPRAKAVDLLVDRVHMDRCHAEAEVRRYAATPSYQLAYAVGRREIRGLRADVERRQGASFELRGFHDAVLEYGGLPVSLIRWGMGFDA